VLVQVLCIGVVPYALASFTSPVLMALGRSATLRTFAFSQLISTIVFTFAAAPFGLVAVAWANVARSYLALPFQLWMLRSASGLRPQDALGAVARPLLASLLMGAAVWTLMELIKPYFSIVLVPLVICMVAGVLIYGVLIYAISAEARQIARNQLKSIRAKVRAS
jgi:hypothetical protein